MTSAFGKWKIKTGLTVPKSNLNKVRQKVLSEVFRTPQDQPTLNHYILPNQSASENFYLMYQPTTSEPRRVARLYSPYFSNTRTGFCLTFHYLIQSHVTRYVSLKVFLLPCNPPYRIPVLTVTDNRTDSWRKSVVPLPDYKRPYRILFEARAGNKNLEFVAIDDIVFARCGEFRFRLFVCVTRWSSCAN